MGALGTSEKLSKLMRTAKELSFNDRSKIVLISDCHRGIGNNSDNFAKNQHLYYSALMHYNWENYTYIELGDGDELWENSDFCLIAREYSHIFSLLARMRREGRLYMIYGNHDIVKRNLKWTSRNLCYYRDDRSREYLPLFPDQIIPEALILRHMPSDNRILLTHGHQGDLLNDTLWRLGRVLVRYLWQPLESIGIMDPTSTSQNHHKKDLTEKKMIDWCQKNHQMLIAGHTHRPVFPTPEEALYFNDGSCVHPRCITALEIACGRISLVKWSVNTKPDGVLFVSRNVLESPVALQDFWRE